MRDGWRIALAIAAASNLVNGGWMLADPVGWYHAIPGVSGSGPLNEHFVRDVGATFTVLGLALARGAAVPAERPLAIGVVAAFYVAHALVHVWDVARGLFPPGQWRLDVLPIHLPAVVMVAALVAVSRARSPR